ncbi:MAG: hypothetical protein M3Y37_10950 [Chloroflexota bacterium]|nr:hypothetical protein [Chloroflexota bacterium]
MRLRYSPPTDDEPEDERPIIPLDQLDEETRREVLKTRFVIKMVAFVSIGLIALMIVITVVAVALTYGD